MFGLGGTETWFSALDKTVGSWVGVATKPFQGGFVNGLETVVGGIWEAGKANPYATAVTLGIGAVTIYAYKNRGFGVGLGKINFSMSNFLAHFNISTGFGRQKINNWNDVDTRLEDIENQLAEAKRIEARHNNQTLRNFEVVVQAIADQRKDTAELGRQMHDSFEFVNKNFTAAYEHRNKLHAETQQGLQAIVGETSRTNTAINAMRPGGGQ